VVEDFDTVDNDRLEREKIEGMKKIIFEYNRK